MYYWELSLKEIFSNQEEDYSAVIRLTSEKNSLLKDNTNEEEFCKMKTLYSAVLTLFKLFKDLRSQQIILLL